MTSERPTARVPVAIVSGFLGAGKSTLIDRILSNPQGKRFATIVNDLSEYSAESKLLKRGALRNHSDVFELKAGCICCNLRDELAERLHKLYKTGNYDYILVEASGISEPLPVVSNFFSEDDDNPSIESFARVDATITVVDALNFPLDFDRADSLQDRRIALDSADDRAVSDVLAEQVEFANIIVINKVDLVTDAELRRLEALLRQLNPEARLLRTTHGIASLDQLLDTEAFDFEKASQSSGWQRAISGEPPPPSCGEFQLGSFVYRARRPFHPGRLWDALQTPFKGIARVKGFFWLASRHNHAGIWSQAGGAFRDDLAGRWWASLPRDEWPEEAEAQAEIHRLSEEPYGDRRQEIVFIGSRLSPREITEALDVCLLDDMEMSMGQLAWESFADPFSVWWDEDEGEISGNRNYPAA